MSGQHQESAMLTAMDVRARAAEWLAQRVSEDWSEDRRPDLDAWLAESLTHRIAFLRVSSAWSNTYRLAALRASTPPQDDSERKSVPFAARRAAALALVVIVSIVGVRYFLTAQDEIYTTRIGDHKTIALDDGSQIELNTDTALRVSTNDGARTVTLVRGEAFFQIKHDASRPFEVVVGNHRIIDLGTKFLIRSEPGRLEVVLVEGRARLQAMDANMSAQPAILVPGDVAIAEAGSVSLTRKSAGSVAAELGWQRGVLVFDSTPLAKAAAEFNRYNSEKLIIHDASAARLKIDGTFPVKDVHQFTEVAQAVFGLHIEKLGDETVISR